MTTAWVPLATTTLGATASSVTFSSIPADYRDLILVINGTLTSSAESIIVQVGNGTISTSGYSFVYAVNTISGALSTASFGLAGYASSTEISTSITQFFDYSATDKHKTWLGRRGPVNAFVGMDASRWANTIAIDIMKVFPENGYAFAAGTTLSLYGSNKL